MDELTVNFPEQGRNNPSLHEDVFEAFVGSILIDACNNDPTKFENGLRFAKRFIINLLENLVDMNDFKRNDNYKDTLQRVYQKYHTITPVYTTLYECKHLYKKMFIQAILITTDKLNDLYNKIHNSSIHEDIIRNNHDNIVQLLSQNYPDANIPTDPDILIIGIGFAENKITSQQDAAKTSLLMLNVDPDTF
jgi:hypothetical protein